MTQVNDEAIKAAREYARRARKGLPEDRWSDGADGSRRVAQGIDALDWCLAYAVEECERLRAQIKRVGDDSISLHAK